MSLHFSDEDDLLEFFRTSTEGKYLLILKWGAAWCGPCKEIQPMFDKLARENKHDRLKFVSVDIQDMEDVVEDFRVSALPTFHLVWFSAGGKQHIEHVFTGADKRKLSNMVQIGVKFVKKKK